jgi:hypothetical protein
MHEQKGKLGSVDKFKNQCSMEEPIAVTVAKKYDRYISAADLMMMLLHGSPTLTRYKEVRF